MRNIDRLHYMDSLRATAMFLGLVLHGAVLFGDWTIGFFRHHDESSLFVRYFPELIHVFRMQLFFFTFYELLSKLSVIDTRYSFTPCIYRVPSGNFLVPP